MIVTKPLPTSTVNKKAYLFPSRRHVIVEVSPPPLLLSLVYFIMSCSTLILMNQVCFVAVQLVIIRSILKFFPYQILQNTPHHSCTTNKIDLIHFNLLKLPLAARCRAVSPDLFFRLTSTLLSSNNFIQLVPPFSPTKKMVRYFLQIWSEPRVLRYTKSVK